jgi:signal transduction histidine kinase
MNFFTTFRGQLLLILAIMLIATLGLQYYLNLISQDENDALRETQEQTLVAAFALGFASITTEQRISDLVEQPGRSLDDAARERIKDIITIDNQWRITDSLNPDYMPDYDENENVVYRKITDVTDLPPLMEGSRLGTDLQYFPNRASEDGGGSEDEAHAIPIETSQGRWYVMVLLRNDKQAMFWRAARPLLYTLVVLLVSSFITFFLVWRFTRPIADLASAARSVAEGGLDVRVPDTGRNDEIGRLVSRFNEMTSQLEKKRELEAQLQQAEKSAVVGRLGSAIAHEIRNPLNYINLTLDHLRAKYAPAEAEKKVLFDKLTAQLKGEVARINQQITDFLNYSRPANADLQPCDARKLLDEPLRIAEMEAAEKNVTVGIVEHENVPQVLADPEFLRSVFNNLFINAIQAMEGKGGGNLTIKISADEDGPFVNFEITDTGTGISEENLANIFEPYFSTRETGTGLGLAIVHKIVDVHNGVIDVQSKEGEGTTFTVRLPKADLHTTEADRRRASEEASQKLQNI